MPWENNYAIATPGLAFGVCSIQASILRLGARRAGGSLLLVRGAEAAAGLMAASDTEIERRFVADLEAFYPGSRDIVREVIVQRWSHDAPYSFPGRAGHEAALTRPLGRVCLARVYLEFLCIGAVIATATEAAASIEAALSAQP